MKLSTKSRYGARIMADLAFYANERPVQVSEISKRQSITVKYVEQLLRPLKKAGYISSVRGAKGGYVISKNPKEITLAQIVRLFESQKDIIECINQPKTCDMSVECQIRMAWELVNKAFYQSLESITIDDIVNGTVPPCSELNVTSVHKKKQSNA